MADGDENSTDRNDETSEGTVAENTDQEVAADAGREQPQPSQMESFFAITKTLILRGLIIYVIMSFFRRPQAQQEDGATAASRVQAYNIFENSSIMVNENDLSEF